MFKLYIQLWLCLCFSLIPSVYWCNIVFCSYGSFFGPSQPVIAQRVIQESKSILETQHLHSRVSNSPNVVCIRVFMYLVLTFCFSIIHVLDVWPYIITNLSVQAKKNPVATPQSNPKVHIKAPKNDVIEPLYFSSLAISECIVFGLQLSSHVLYLFRHENDLTYFMMTISFVHFLEISYLKFKSPLANILKLWT